MYKFLLFRTDQRIEFLEICYTAPEELLSEMGVTVGILGKKRSEYDEMLKKREPPKRRRDDSLSYSFVSTEATEAEEDLEFQFTFIIPNKVQHRYVDIKFENHLNLGNPEIKFKTREILSVTYNLIALN